MYMPRPKKRGAYLTRSVHLREFQDAMREYLIEAISDEEVASLKEELKNPKMVIHLRIKYGFESSTFFREDASNYVKAIEDCISRRIGIDDSRNCKVYVEKELSEETEAQIELETYELPFDIPKDKKWKASRKK